MQPSSPNPSVFGTVNGDRAWNYELCEPCSSQACFACFCPICTFSNLFVHVEEHTACAESICCGVNWHETTPENINMLRTRKCWNYWSCTGWCLWCVNMFIPCVACCCFLGCLRKAWRNRQKIKGNIASDFCASCCCSCCVYSQVIFLQII